VLIYFLIHCSLASLIVFCHFGVRVSSKFKIMTSGFIKYVHGNGQIAPLFISCLIMMNQLNRQFNVEWDKTNQELPCSYWKQRLVTVNTKESLFTFLHTSKIHFNIIQEITRYPELGGNIRCTFTVFIIFLTLVRFKDLFRLKITFRNNESV
jgi:hypothetical protein